MGVLTKQANRDDWLIRVQDQNAQDAVSSAEMMTIAQDPVKDSSFLGTTASDLCANTPVYWTYTACFNNTATST